MPALHTGTRTPSRLATIALGIAFIGSASMLYYHLGLFIPRALQTTASKGLGNGYSFGNDFYQVWLTARVCVPTRLDPYSEKMTREIQVGLYGRPLDSRVASDPIDRRSFPYPAFTLLLFWPVTQVPFDVIRVVMAILLAGLSLASVVLWMRALAWRPRGTWLVVVCLSVMASYAVLEGLYAGQLGLMVGFLLAASIVSLQRGHLAFAGVLMSLTTIKPQVAVLVILYLLIWSVCLWRERKRFVIGFFSTFLLLMGVSAGCWPHWIESWIRTLAAYHQYTTPALVEEVLTSHLPAAAIGPTTAGLVAAAVGLSIVLAWQQRALAAASVGFVLTVSVLLALTSVTLIPGQAVYDHVVLLPGIFWLATRWKILWVAWIGRALLTVGVAILVWPWIASLCVILLRLALTPQQFYSTPIFSLPLRTAAVLPFVVLALLGVAMRRARIEATDNDLSAIA